MGTTPKSYTLLSTVIIDFARGSREDAIALAKHHAETTGGDIIIEDNETEQSFIVTADGVVRPWIAAVMILPLVA